MRANASDLGLSRNDWHHLRQLEREAAEDGAENGARKLSAPLHHLQVQNGLSRHEAEGLRAARSHKQKHKDKVKALDLRQRKEYHSVAVFWC